MSPFEDFADVPVAVEDVPVPVPVSGGFADFGNPNVPDVVSAPAPEPSDPAQPRTVSAPATQPVSQLGGFNGFANRPEDVDGIAEIGSGRLTSTFIPARDLPFSAPPLVPPKPEDDPTATRAVATDFISPNKLGAAVPEPPLPMRRQQVLDLGFGVGAAAGSGTTARFVDVPDYEKMTDRQLARSLGVTVEQATSHRAKGRIGFLENITTATGTELGEKAPVAGPFFTIARNTAFEAHANVLGGWNDALKQIKTEYDGIDRDVHDPAQVQDIQKIFADSYDRTKKEMLSSESAVFMDEYLDKRAEALIRGKTLAAEIGSGISILPAYMLEFLATGGVYSATRKAITRIALRTGMKRLAARAVGAFAGTGVRVAILSAGPIAKADQALLPNIQKDVTGRFVITKTDKSKIREYFKQFGIAFTEQLGEVSSIGGLRAVGAFSPKARAVMQRLASGKTLSAAGYNGFVLEMGEERFTQLMRYVSGQLGFDLDEDNLLPSIREFFVEAGVLAAPGAVSFFVNKIRKEPSGFVEPEAEAKVELPIIEEAEPETISEEELSEISEPGVEAVEDVEGTEFPVPLEVREPTRKRPIDQPEPDLKAPATSIGEVGIETDIAEAVRGPLGAPMPAADKIPTTVKGLVNRITGVVKTTSALFQRKIMEAVMKGQSRAAKIAYQQAGKDMVASGRDLTETAATRLSGLDIPESARNGLMRAVSTARTPSQKRDAAIAIEAVAQTAEKQAATARVTKLLQERPEGMSPVLKKIWDGVVPATRPTATKDSTIQKLVNFLGATNQELGENEFEQIPIDLIDRAKDFLSRVDKPSLQDMTPQELVAAEDIISRLTQQVRTFTVARAKTKARKFEAGRVMAAESVQNVHPDPRHPIDDDAGAIRRVARVLRGIWWDLAATMDSFAHMIGGDRSRFWNATVGRAILASERAIDNRRNLFEKPLQKALDAARISVKELETFSPDLKKPGSGKNLKTVRKFTRTINISPIVSPTGKTSIPRSFDATPGEVIQMLLMFADPEIRAELLRNKQGGFTFRVGRFGGGTMKLNIEDMSLISEQATAKERAVADIMNEIYNGEVAQLMNDLWIRTRGHSFTKNFDMAPSYRVAVRKDAAKNEDPLARRKRHYTNLDQLTTFQRRTGGDAAYVVEDAFTVFTEHAVQISDILAKDEVYNEIRELLTDDRVKGAGFTVDGTATMIARHVKDGKMILQEMISVLDQFGALDSTRDANAGGVKKVANFLLNKFSFGKLALKPQIMLYQKLSLINASEFVSFKNLYHADILKPATKGEATEVSELIGSVADRFTGGAARLMSAGMSGNFTARAMAIGSKISLVERVGTGGIHRVDKGTIIHLWRAVKLQTNGDLEKARELLILVINRTQPHWDSLNIPSVSRAAKNNPFLKMAMLFSSQRTTNNTSVLRAWTNFSQAKEAADRASAESKAGGESIASRFLKREQAIAKFRLRLATEIMRHMVVTGTGVLTIKTGLNILLSGGDDERWKDYRFWIEGIVDNTFGNFMLGTGIVPAYATKRLLNKYITGDSELKYDYSGEDPVRRTWEDMKGLIREIDDFWSGEGGKGLAQWEQALISLGRLLSNFGAPTDGPAQIFKKMRFRPRVKPAGSPRPPRPPRPKSPNLVMPR